MAKRKIAGLSPLEVAFLLQHHKTGCANASAAFLAVNPNVNMKSAFTSASRTLAKPEAQAELARLRARVEDKAIITREEILRELRAIGMSNIGNFTELGPDGKIRVINFDMEAAKDPNTLAAISSIETQTRTIKGRNGDSDEEVTTSKVRLWDKTQALVAAGKEIGMFVERSQQLGADGQPVNPMTMVPSTLIVKFVDPKAKKK